MESRTFFFHFHHSFADFSKVITHSHAHTPAAIRCTDFYFFVWGAFFFVAFLSVTIFLLMSPFFLFHLFLEMWHGKKGTKILLFVWMAKSNDIFSFHFIYHDYLVHLSGESFSWCLHPPLPFLHTIFELPTAHCSDSVRSAPLCFVSCNFTCLIFLHFTWIRTNVENKLSLKTKRTCGEHRSSHNNNNSTQQMTLIVKWKLAKFKLYLLYTDLFCLFFIFAQCRTIRQYQHLSSRTRFAFNSVGLPICTIIKHFRLLTAKNRQRQISFEQWMTERQYAR